MTAALVSGWAWLPAVLVLWTLAALALIGAVRVATSTPTPKPYRTNPAWMREGL